MREKFKPLQICVTTVLIVQIVTGIILIGMTADFHCTFAKYLLKNEKQTLFSELSNIYLQGFELLACYFAALGICRMTSKREKFTENIVLMAIWNGFSFVIEVCGLAHVWFLNCSIELLQNIVESSLFEGIDLYFSNPEWKLLWDEIQYQHECCGVNGYEDWKNASWIPVEESDCETRSSPGEMMFIPYVCCKRTASMCFQTYAPHSTAFTGLNLNSSEINQGGCSYIFIDLSARYYIKIAAIMLSVLILHIVLLILQITMFCKVKNVSHSCRDVSDKKPLIVVKYSRDVRCIALTDDDHFDHGVEDDKLHECRLSNQSVCSCQELKRNVFLH